MGLAVELACTVAVTATSLEVGIIVHNREPRDVALFNRVPLELPDGTAVYAPEIGYLELDGDTLAIRKIALPIPPGLTMTAYVPPAVTRLVARGMLRETMRLAIPVKVMQPFRRALLAGQVTADRPATAQKLTVEVGVFLVDEGLILEPADPAHRDVFTVAQPGLAVARQEILSRTFPLDQPVSVLDYRAVPWT
jgi:hypothetical protein